MWPSQQQVPEPSWLPGWSVWKHWGIGRKDDAFLRIQKRLLTRLTLYILPLALLQSLYLAYLDRWIPALVTGIYVLGSGLNLWSFKHHQRLSGFAFIQVLLLWWTPWMLTIVLGGVAQSGGVVMWMMLCPLVFLWQQQPKTAGYWLAAVVAGWMLLLPLLAWLPEETGYGIWEKRVFFFLNLGLVAGVVFLVLEYFILRSMQLQMASDQLLFNLLPATIAEKLRRKGRVPVRSYPDATVLFADLEGFTELSRKVSASDLVAWLDRLFTHLDDLCEAHGVEKIKTIGDNYMVASEIPQTCANHAQRAWDFALSVQAFAQNVKMPDGKPVRFRIGIHSGPVIAGVIGRKKFLYDVWGETVNVAARLEQNAQVNEIWMTETAFGALKQKPTTGKWQSIDLKGVGECNVWIFACT